MVGADYVPYDTVYLHTKYTGVRTSNDRAVWDYLSISIATGPNGTFTPVGCIGIKDDGFVDVTLEYFSFPSTQVQYVKYEFGAASADWGGGSRVWNLYAQDVQSQVPIPAAAWLISPCSPVLQ